MGIAVALALVVAFGLKKHFTTQDFETPTRLEQKHYEDISDSTLVR